MTFGLLMRSDVLNRQKHELLTVGLQHTAPDRKYLRVLAVSLMLELEALQRALGIPQGCQVRAQRLIQTPKRCSQVGQRASLQVTFRRAGQLRESLIAGPNFVCGVDHEERNRNAL